jgi:hypothetical protein
MSKRKSLTSELMAAGRPNKLPRPYEIFKDSSVTGPAYPAPIAHFPAYPAPMPEVQHHINNSGPTADDTYASNVQYPTTFLSFADGIKSDLYEIMSTGASILFPFGGGNSAQGNSSGRMQKQRDDADDIADFANGRQIPLAAKPNGYGSNVLSKPLRPMTQSEIGMRCPSAYREKENKTLASVPSIPRASAVMANKPPSAKPVSAASLRGETPAPVGLPGPAETEHATVRPAPSKASAGSGEKLTKPSADAKPKYSGGMKVGDQISQAKLVGNAKLPVSINPESSG